MRQFIQYFIRYDISGNVLMALIFIFGLIGVLNMRSTFFPQAPSRSLTIQLAFPGASPEEIEESVVLKIEDNLKGVTGIERVTSTTNENAAVIRVETKYNAEVEDVLQDVKNRVDQITSFPVGLETINIFEDEPRNNAATIALHGKVDLKALKKAARTIERDFLEYEGISKVELSGFPEEEIAIQVNENQLRAYGLTFDAVMRAVAASNIDVTGGTIKGTNEELKIRVRNKQYSGTELHDVVVKATADGRLVRLRDVAEIEDAWAETPNRNYYNGEPSVTIDVFNTNDEDLIAITSFVREFVEDYNGKQDLIQADITNDASVNVRARINLLLKNGIIGFILVFVILAFFLHWRLAFWVALAIPISFCGMFILANFFGVTINVISLFGMITVIGILVDDGVVICENIYRHYERGATRMQAAIRGTMEVIPAVVSAILTTIVAFSTFFFIQGRLGDFFSEMAFIVIATLIFSLVEGALILPAHVAHSKALNRGKDQGKFVAFTKRTLAYLRDNMYKPVLMYCLNNRFLTVAIPVAILIITMGAISGGIIKTTFFPFIEREQVTVTLKMPSGTPEAVTNEMAQRVEEATWAANRQIQNERADGREVVLSIDKRMGPTKTNEATLNIKLLNNEDRQMSVLYINNVIRDNLGVLPGIEELSFGTGSAFGLPVSVALKSSDLQQVRAAAEDLKAELRNLSDLKDVKDNDLEGSREVIITLKDKAYLLGLNLQQVIGQIRQGYFGAEVQRIQRGLDEVRVWVRYERDARASIGNLEDMRIRAGNASYPLSEIAYFEIKRGVVAINHTDGKREIRVEADVAAADVSVTDMIANVEENILPGILAKYPDIRYSMEGQVREQQRSAGSGMKVFPVVLLLMLAIIVLTFRSVPQTLAVLLLIPFAFIGVAWGHWIHGLPISLFTFLGVIALIGIVVNDSLVFVSAFNTNIKDGLSFRESLVEAALSRFRPILLTSITTIAGLAPLILETSFQAQFLIPMAAAIAYGLGVGTFIILILLPVFLLSINKMRRFGHWFWNDEKKLAKEVEPAYLEMQYEDVKDNA